MKLEECTKDELIWIIQNRCFRSAEDFEFDILMLRGEKINSASSAEFKRANSALGEYCRLLEPYSGKPLSSIPNAVLSKANEWMKVREAALKKYDRLEKQYREISRHTDRILGLGEDVQP
ncbi:hypothetical protein [Oscillibacter sp.]|uniref:hypothetical protein n=1 Tax=Oscillibacter sp. TaxID=1945593 RepID=UPI0028ABF8B4|nr:hypothetical protein [Oscillibacter sp.]